MEYDAAQGFQAIHDEPGRRSQKGVSGWDAEPKNAARCVCAPPRVRNAR
ncbi:hypothetical protein DM43_61 [Burkholderia cepacia]|uniref:Uncharacterized protein n=1 Tax=Burkholderia cepacia TaxID=292 RepID=A0AA88Z375_BURCE|nr:hypothetical protein DM43_61 [Burkholderia cepacia]